MEPRYAVVVSIVEKDDWPEPGVAAPKTESERDWVTLAGPMTWEQAREIARRVDELLIEMNPGA